MTTIEQFAGWAPWLVVAILAAAYWYGEKRREWKGRWKNIPRCVHGRAWDRCPVCREG